MVNSNGCGVLSLVMLEGGTGPPFIRVEESRRALQKALHPHHRFRAIHSLLSEGSWGEGAGPSIGDVMQKGLSGAVVLWAVNGLLFGQVCGGGGDLVYSEHLDFATCCSLTMLLLLVSVPSSGAWEFC